MIEINNKKLCESCFCEVDGETCPHCGFSKSEYTPDPLVLPMGAKLNDKIIIGRIMGKGGFGVTYLGYDTRLDKVIAVKEYYPNGIAYRLPSGTEVSVADTKSVENFDKGAEKFYAEAEMVAQFNGNPNIVSVYDYFRENNTVYLVMEYISGVTLKNYIKKHGKLSDGQALYVMDKITAALSITHSAGVLHRDISPDNIMICRDGKVKLIDFGAARQIMAESSSNLTVVLKPGYTPVEQYTKKGKQGAWTDIYSLGVSVYYALTEVIIDDPYARMDDDSELDANTHGINDELWAILKKCTMITASERYSSAIDLRKALKSVSAPIKAEPLSLDEDDLKLEETAAAPDAISENVSADKAFPVTAASDNDGGKTAAIEIFEESTAVPNVKDTDVPVKSPDKKKSNKSLIAGSCAAAAVIIGIIGIALAGNKPADEDIFTAVSTETSTAAVTESSTTTKKDSSEKKDSTSAKLPAETTATTVPKRDEEISISIVTTAAETTSTAETTTTTTAAATTTTATPATTAKVTTTETTTTKVTTTTKATTTTTTTTMPEKIEKPLYVKLSDTYEGRYKNKPLDKNYFKYFDGDVKVVLDIECVSVNKNDEGGYWRSICIRDGRSDPVDVNAPNAGRDYWDNYGIYEKQKKFTFILKHTDIDKLYKELRFNAANVIVKSATIYDYDPDEYKVNPKAKIIQLDSKYPDRDKYSSPIPKKELESFKGDVKVTLSIKRFNDETDEIIEAGKKWYWVSIYPYGAATDDWRVHLKADNTDRWEDWSFELAYIDVPDKLTFVISSSEISRLGDEGLMFGCRNIIITSAALEKA